ncbi:MULTISPECIES: hypothetical protein [unclassified Cellulosimicrobium]|uniref:Uncharacterized protein n=1 Tax=Cellulosimicrobium sp. ES-005 TaxID=3163031 RepID=A0AAU8FZL3_9MICO|nr:hypothetical protein [Cellulosimicrobium sp. TH-20]
MTMTTDRIEKATPLRDRLEAAGIDAMEFSERVGLALGTVLWASVTDAQWAHYVERYTDAGGR